MEIASGLNVPRDEIIVDYLLACGLGYELASDQVAACSARVVENTAIYGAPTLVLLVGDEAAAAASGAGLLSNGKWMPVGAVPSLVLFAPSWAISRELLQEIEASLGLKVRPRPWPKDDLQVAEELLNASGAASGSASMEIDGRTWRRRASAKLLVGQVDQHLRGIRFWGPFRPDGAWPFVVIDVDRHDALQEKHFFKTKKMLEQVFPKSCFITSSASGGLHIYVKLPRGTQYEEAAVWLETFFALNKLLFVDEKVSRVGAKPTFVRSARVEVPRHPVRLPFGRGSRLVRPRLRAAKPTTKASVAAFVRWLRTASSSDFDTAKAFVEQQLRCTGEWSKDKKNYLQKQIDKAHVEGLAPIRLDAADPWFEILARLPPPLRVVATRGVPAMGTRTKWTQSLIDVLFDLVPPDQVEALMLHWLRSRDHRSEDIEMDLLAVEHTLRRSIHRKKKTLHGVPIRILDFVEKRLNEGNYYLRKARSPGWALPHPHVEIGHLAPLLTPHEFDEALELGRLTRQVAFYVLRGFFDRRTPKTEGSDGERPISAREFSRSLLPKAMRTAVKEFFLLSGWLVRSGEPERGRFATRYKLAKDLFPALPGEPVLFVPP